MFDIRVRSGSKLEQYAVDQLDNGFHKIVFGFIRRLTSFGEPMYSHYT